MKRVLMKAAIAIFVILTGCATTRGGWYKEGASQDEFYRVRGRCVAQARAGNQNPYAMFDQIIFTGCMQGEGFYWITEPINN